MSSQLQKGTTQPAMSSQLQKGTTVLSDLTTPSFVVNRQAFVKNCIKVRDEAKKNGIHRIRPHVKTHKTVEGTYIQAYCSAPPKGESDDNAATDVIGFVASTIPEIEMIVKANENYGGPSTPFRDVVYAVPISEAKLIQIDKLNITDKVDLHLLIDHPSQVEMIERFISEGRNKSASGTFSTFLKLDTGYHRAGISCDDRGIDLAIKILASKSLWLKGLYSHCGHAYDTNNKANLDEIARKDLSLILQFIDDLKRQVKERGKDELLDVIDILDLSVGSTPSLFHHSNVDSSLQKQLEIHPGNYAFYDRQQLFSGAAEDESCLAGRVLTRVIGHYEDRNTLMLDAGATALTKDTAPQGGVCAISGHPDLECYKMSQEVTLVRPRDSSQALKFADFPLGSMLTILPNHSCLAAACFDKYHVIDDASCKFSAEESVIDEWIPVKGW